MTCNYEFLYKYFPDLLIVNELLIRTPYDRLMNFIQDIPNYKYYIEGNSKFWDKYSKYHNYGIDEIVEYNMIFVLSHICDNYDVPNKKKIVDLAVRERKWGIVLVLKKYISIREDILKKASEKVKF